MKTRRNGSGPRS